MDTLIHYGGAIKAVGESETGWKFGGYLVVFDTQDVSAYKDRFTKSTTKNNEEAIIKSSPRAFVL